MFNLIAVICGVLALIVYMKAVRYDKDWGTPVMTLLVLASIVSVILPYTGIKQRRQMKQWERMQHMHLALLGEKLAPQLSDGANVLLLTIDEEDMYTEEDLEMAEGEYREEMESYMESREERRREMVENFETGAGIRINLLIEGSDDYYDDYTDAKFFNEMIAPYRDENIDLIISEFGLPSYSEYDEDTHFDKTFYELEYLICFEWDDRPLFAADIGRQYDAEKIKSYFEDDYLDAVVFFDPDDRWEKLVVGPDNLDELPEPPQL